MIDSSYNSPYMFKAFQTSKNYTLLLVSVRSVVKTFYCFFHSSQPDHVCDLRVSIFIFFTFFSTFRTLDHIILANNVRFVDFRLKTKESKEIKIFEEDSLQLPILLPYTQTHTYPYKHNKIPPNKESNG